MKQRIEFEQGGPIDGDTGERGDSTVTPDGGAVSIKPVIDGERAEESVYNRPGENIRKRTEQLRDVGEQQLYLQDSDMRWILVGGNASGLSPTPWPAVTAWNKDGGGAGKGTFVISEPIVVQPINTPATDVQETVTYPFEDSLLRTAQIDFEPLSTKRAYNLANIIRIVWQAVPASELVGAVVPNYCDVAVTGDAKHILTISIRDDNLTQMVNLDTALTSIAADLVTMGLDYTVTGDNTTFLEWADIIATPYGDDYVMEKNFEREIHRIIPSAFADFFTGGGYLADGDTLSVWFEDYTNTAGPPPTGRRQCTPSNANSNVPHTQLFVTSRATEKIPLAVPLCKRIGDDLLWLDGTVILDGQLGSPRMGEHGYTVNRIVNGASTINLAAHSSASPLSVDPIDVTVASIQTNVNAIVDRLNDKGTLDEDEVVTGVWTFEPPRSSGTPTGNLNSVRVVTTLDGIALTGSYNALYNDLVMSAGSVSAYTQGSFNQLTFSGGSAASVTGNYNNVIVAATGVITGYIRGISANLNISAGATLGNNLYTAYFFLDNDADLPGTVSLYGKDIYLNNSGDLVSGNIYGSTSRVVNSGTLTSGELCGYKAQVTGGSGVLTSGSLHGLYVDIISVGTLTNGVVYGIRNALNIEATASLGDLLYGLYSNVILTSGATIGDHVYGLYSNVDSDTDFSGTQDIRGGRVRVESSGTLASGHIYGFQAVVNHPGTLTTGDLFGVYISVNNATGNVGGDLYGWYYTRGIGGTVSGDTWAIYTAVSDPSHHAGALNIGSNNHPAGNGAIKVAIDGAFATHSNGIENMGNPGSAQEPSVANIGILTGSPAFTGSYDVKSLQNGVVGQWLIIENIANIGQGTLTLKTSAGGGSYQIFHIAADIVLNPGEGVLCYFGGTYWHVVSN